MKQSTSLSKPIGVLRKTVIGTLIAVMMIPAQAGFLDDFYTSNGANVNITNAGIFEGQASTVISGGGFSARIPNRSFTPFSITPPSFNAGCGGIDLYLGAFGFPTKAEMTAFLRNVGQSAGGIAFSIALKALSPELDSTINDFSKQMQEMMRNFKNSCQAAQTLMDKTGAGAFIHEMATNAKRQMRLTSSDETEAEVVAADPVKAKQNALAHSVANPNSNINPERNVIWDAIHLADASSVLTDAEKRFILAITGSTVITLSDPNDSSLPITVDKPPLHTNIAEAIKALAGSRTDNSITIATYRCQNGGSGGAPTNAPLASNNCLVMTQNSESIGGGIRYRLGQASDTVITSMRSRQAITPTVQSAYLELHKASFLPLLQLTVQAASTKNNGFVNEAFLGTFLDMAAQDLANRMITDSVERARKSVSQGQNSPATNDVLLRSIERMNAITRALDADRLEMLPRVQQLTATMQLHQSVQSYLRQSVSSDLSRSLNMGGNKKG